MKVLQSINVIIFKWESERGEREMQDSLSLAVDERERAP